MAHQLCGLKQAQCLFIIALFQLLDYSTKIFVLVVFACKIKFFWHYEPIEQYIYIKNGTELKINFATWDKSYIQLAATQTINKKSSKFQLTFFQWVRQNKI